jgi:hypothetical protein
LLAETDATPSSSSALAMNATALGEEAGKNKGIKINSFKSQIRRRGVVDSTRVQRTAAS